MVPVGSVSSMQMKYLIWFLLLFYHVLIFFDSLFLVCFSKRVSQITYQVNILPTKPTNKPYPEIDCRKNQPHKLSPDLHKQTDTHRRPLNNWFLKYWTELYKTRVYLESHCSKSQSPCALNKNQSWDHPIVPGGNSNPGLSQRLRDRAKAHLPSLN